MAAIPTWKALEKKNKTIQEKKFKALTDLWTTKN
jgi:hypothetical protein